MLDTFHHVCHVHRDKGTQLFVGLSLLIGWSGDGNRIIDSLYICEFVQTGIHVTDKMCYNRDGCLNKKLYLEYFIKGWFHVRQPWWRWLPKASVCNVCLIDGKSGVPCQLTLSLHKKDLCPQYVPTGCFLIKTWWVERQAEGWQRGPHVHYVSGSDSDGSNEW